MKRVFAIVLLTFCVALSYAADIVCVGEPGTVTQVEEGIDTIYIFKNEIHMRSNVGPIDWFYSDGSLYASNVEEIYPEDGCYTANGSRFCVELYKSLDALSLRLEPTCENSLLHVSGITGARTRAYSLTYNALAWNGEAWADSAVVMEGKLAKTIMMPALYSATPIRLCYDADIRAALEMDSAIVETELTPDSVLAVKQQITSLVTTREAENELNRPTDQSVVEGNTYSGPLEVKFFSNPTPAARFYKWSIYKSTELIASRNDKDPQYAFAEPGAYRVVCSVTNGTCFSDSTEVAVAISESYLKVPNVFTPNGDGKNDEFRVAFRSLRMFHIQVYNRWGKLVYDSTNPEQGWDGNINGKPAAEGAYFYVVRAFGTDAPEDAQFMMKAVYDNKKKKDPESILGIYQLSGDINLIR